MSLPESAGAQLARGPMSILSEWASTTRAYRRNRVPIRKKVLAAALCNSGYSYREVASMVGGMSYVAVRDSFFSLVTSLPKEERKYRRGVAIDGDDVDSGRGSFHLWLARDAETGEMMSFQASPGASAADGARFLAGVAAQCTNRPYLKMGEGENSPRGLVNLDLYFQPSGGDSLMVRLGRLILRSEG